MKKIDILNFITSNRKSPNDIKTITELRSHLGVTNDQALSAMLAELQQLRVVRELEKDGEKAYQVMHK
jgi:hypothetical protein